MALPPTVVGASRPHPSETENGDGWSTAWFGGVCRITIVDGLGHGPLAAEVARQALSAASECDDPSPLGTLRAVHTALIGSRGAAVTVASVDPDSLRVTYAGVGNVEGRLWIGQQYRAFSPMRGIVGYRWPSSIVAIEHQLEPNWLLLLYSDGLERRSLPSARPDLDPSGQRLVDGLLASGARLHDDATIVAAYDASF